MMRPTEVSIQWSAPVAPNGIITMYSVKCGSSQEPANTSLLHYKCMRLQPGLHHTITVTAYTIAGPGDVVSVQQKTPCEGNSVCIVKLSCVSHSYIVLYLTFFFFFFLLQFQHLKLRLEQNQQVWMLIRLSVLPLCKFLSFYA